MPVYTQELDPRKVGPNLWLWPKPILEQDLQRELLIYPVDGDCSGVIQKVERVVKPRTSNNAALWYAKTKQDRKLTEPEYPKITKMEANTPETIQNSARCSKKPQTAPAAFRSVQSLNRGVLLWVG